MTFAITNVMLAWTLAASVGIPTCHDDRLAIELFAVEPDIVTPTGITVDDQGNPLVIECHTHFPPPGYDGPKTDRIRRFEDTNGDGRADRITTFWEGSKSTMGIGRHLSNGWTYVATRDSVFRLRDADGNGAAELNELLVTLESADHYPHSGIAGFAFDDAGNVFFGFGENHAEPFKMRDADGTTLTGIEGGHVYRMKPDGSKLQRVAIGCWNPFHLTFDAVGRLFAVDNDPDSLPPCRLLHIVPGGDYGYKYRNGRKGTHPFTAWNGELPGTLPMVAGTGEAPSGVYACKLGDKLPYNYRGDLLVTSWGDHRIERYRLQPRGASVSAERIDVISGNENFRPVGIVAGGDGSLYISDWVDKSYELHKQGRLWRLRTIRPDDPTKPLELKAAKSVEEQRAESLRTGADTVPIDKLWQVCEETDSFLQQAARMGLQRRGAVTPTIDLKPLNPARRLTVALVLRTINDEASQLRLPELLNDPHPDVRFVALQWIGEEKVAACRPVLAETLKAGPITARLFAGYLAAIEKLDRSPRKDSDEWTNEQYLIEVLFSAETPLEVRQWAIRSLRPDHAALTGERFQAWLADPQLQLEGIRSLRESRLANRESLLWEVVAEGRNPTRIRAEAIVGLVTSSPDDTARLVSLACGNEVLRDEALRSLRGAQITEEQRGQLEKLAVQPTVRDLVARVITASNLNLSLPAITDTDSWLKLLDGPADAASGERVFYHPKSAHCGRCHQVEGRGGSIGPDLTVTARTLGRRRLVESILQPSKEIAPHFVSWTIQTTDGHVLTGMLVGETVKGEQRYADQQGKIFTLKPSEIESRKQLTTSIMPEGLVHQMTAQELRDVLAFLQERVR